MAYGATVSYNDSFESYSSGAQLVGNNGWTGDADAAIVTTATYSISVPPGYPLPSAVHSQVAVVSKPLSNTNSSSEGSNVNVDFMVKPVLRDAPPDTISNNVQVAMYFDTNGYLTVRHSAGSGVYTQLWTTLNTTPIGTSEWVRVSVAMAYTNDGNADTYFSVYLNGTQISDGLGYATPSSSAASPGPWLMCADSPGYGGGGGNPWISSFSTEGECMLDDVVVKYEPLSWTTGGFPPSGWLAGFGLANGDSDDDNDGRLSWEEYCASTDPTVSNSQFRVVEQGINGSGYEYLKWVCVGVDPALGAFSVEKSTDLTAVGGGWAAASPACGARVEGTNTWTEDSLAVPGAFYRLRAPCE